MVLILLTFDESGLELHWLKELFFNSIRLKTPHTLSYRQARLLERFCGLIHAKFINIGWKLPTLKAVLRIHFIWGGN
jgi:hypothetical protein